MTIRRLNLRHRPRGFALIEVIMGGVMLGIGIAAVISITSRSLASQVKGENILVASWLADEKLSMVLVEGPETFPKIHDTYGTFEAPFEEYEYEIDIQEQGPRKPYRVLATIRWPNAQGTSEITVETLIAARLGEDLVPREPIEILDRDSRYFDEEE
ncbi:MAG: type II secretion system protein [Planctomycetota bacterium]|nr:type II secretion system protein [Planctomycetota bacterium]